MNIVYAMGLGFLLDCILGDPHSLPHPVRWIGSLIRLIDEQLHLKRKFSHKVQFFCGILLVVSVLAATGTMVFLVRDVMYRLSDMAGIGADGILFYYCIAPRSLYRESMAVREALEKSDKAAAETLQEGSGRQAEALREKTGGQSDRLQEARRKLSMIVGRDTEQLTEEGIIKAAVETVAENTSDGVTAPIIYMAIGGPVLCFLYKAVNTMDSMVGYHNDMYEYFGKAAAGTDDLWNYIPSRLTAWAMIFSAFLLHFSEKSNNSDNNTKLKCLNNSTNYRDAGQNLLKTDWKRGISIYRRDRRNHKSPNSAQTESVCAGVLGIQLAGDASYFGRTVHKPYIGDALRTAQREDIRRANRLMYASAVITLLVAAGLRIVCRV